MCSEGPVDKFDNAHAASFRSSFLGQDSTGDSAARTPWLISIVACSSVPFMIFPRTLSAGIYTVARWWFSS